MILYHRTYYADAILRDGFRDAEGSYGLEDFTLRGVFVSDQPLDGNEGAYGDRLIEITLSDSVDISYYELIEEGKGFREWCLPAELLNSNARLRLVPFDEENQSVST